MSSSLRIAVSEGLPVTGTGLHVVRAESGNAGALDERLRQRWLRLLRERRRREAPAALETALQEPGVRALLLLLDHGAEAALLSESGAAAAWALLEPAGTGVCTDLWIGRDEHGSFGWMDAVAGESAAVTASRLQAAAATLAQALGQAAQPLLGHFASGPDAGARTWEHQRATLQARLPAPVAEIYSPLLFAHGRLQTGALLAALRQAAGAAAPVVYIPKLPRPEFEAAFTAAGGLWCGPFRAGAEAPAARVPAGAPSARVAATLSYLAAWAAGVASAR